MEFGVSLNSACVIVNTHFAFNPLPNFYVCSEPFKSSSNKEVVKNLVRDAKAHLRDTTSAMIKGIGNYLSCISKNTL